MVEGGITKVHNKFIGGNGCVYYSVCGDGFTDEYMTVSQILLCKYMQLIVCQFLNCFIDILIDIVKLSWENHFHISVWYERNILSKTNLPMSRNIFYHLNIYMEIRLSYTA